MKTAKTLALLLFTFVCVNQTVLGQKVLSPDSFLIGEEKRPHVFLVGAFHFEYYNLDAYKVEKDKQIDILSPQKQKELESLLDYIAKFRPNKIVIEATSNWKALEKYNQYKAGKIKLGKDERYQIAFRLMDRFNLDNIYSLDVNSLAEDMMEMKEKPEFKKYMDEIFADYKFRANEKYDAYQKYETELSLKLPLLDYFKYLNSPEVLRRDYGAYLLGDFKLGEFRGADALAIYWYNRNLRIFRNIQKITTSPEDRILVLFGSGHIAVLDQLFNASIEYNYIKFNDLR